ncbi:MAG TPA: YD repeat-containing protein, partial [Acidobacteriota bacterium]|nr:YD repeat-containing protein [Acidobacteriota bacterium]
MLRRSLKAIFLFTLLLLGLNSAQGQQSPTDTGTPAALLKGAHPLGSYSGSSFDQVNLFNGNASFSIPLANLNGRAGLGVGVMLSYNSKVWRTESVPGDSTFHSPTYISWDETSPLLAAGWSLSGGHLVARQVNYSEPASCIEGQLGQYTPRLQYTILKLTFTAPDGTEFDFRDDLTDGQPLPLYDRCTLVGPGSRGQRFHSADGSGATFISDNVVYDRLVEYSEPLGFPTSPFPVSGVVILRDGTRYTVNGQGNVVKREDRNGNIVRFDYDASGRLITLTDTLERTITITYGDPGASRIATISWQGFGGVTRTTTIDTKKLRNALRPGEQISRYSTLFPTLRPPS